MPVEGRGLSSRQTQQVARDREIGKPNNSETCSEAADGVTRESEGRSRLSLLCPVRQDQPWGYSGTCLDIPLCRAPAGELIGDHDAWRPHLLLQQFAQEPLGRLIVAAALDQD